MLIQLFVIVRRIKICDGNLIEDKMVEQLEYIMGIFTKYCLILKNIMETITTNNLPWFNMKCYADFQCGEWGLGGYGGGKLGLSLYWGYGGGCGGKHLLG